MRFPAALFIAASIVFSASAVSSADAQTVTRHELSFGPGSSTDTANESSTEFVQGLQRGSLYGPLLRYTFNLNRAVALESSLSDSVDLDPPTLRQGGHLALAMGGVKAGIRRQRFGVFGVWDAGVASFSRGEGQYTAAGLQYNRLTHFALQQGVAVELYPSRRTVLRVDYGEQLNAQFRRVYYNSPYLQIASFSAVPYHQFLNITAGRRFGHTLDTQDRSTTDTHRPLRYSVGGFYTTETRAHLLQDEVRADGGGGAWVEFPLWRFLSADALAYDRPHDDHTSGLQDGGTAFAAFLGPKLGLRRGGFGIFAKARPGVMRFSRVNTAQTITPTSFNIIDHPKIDFALDTGLVTTYTPPARALRHMQLRFEGGSTYIHYHSANFAYAAQGKRFGESLSTLYFIPPQRHSSLLFLSGIGFAF